VKLFPPNFEEAYMSRKLSMALLIYVMVQGVLFGVGLLAILLTPLSSQAMQLTPWMIAITFLVSAPAAYTLAPHMLARREARQHVRLSGRE
jgi:membrane protein implicated in regulation of membrane protease activity